MSIEYYELIIYSDKVTTITDELHTGESGDNFKVNPHETAGSERNSEWRLAASEIYRSAELRYHDPVFVT
ncbi:hypothetical protein N9F11_00375 [Akkermansiaceae bacterium]|nr:hypothetical protein [Akkermansiaceae bacterium]